MSDKTEAEIAGLRNTISDMEREIKDLERDLEAARDDLSDAEHELDRLDGRDEGAEAALDAQIHRLRVLGLDTDLTALEVLERLRDEVAA